MLVEKWSEEYFSAGVKSFPQVIHNEMWNEKRLIYKRLGKFFTFTQALFLILLFLKDIFKVISFRKREMMGYKNNRRDQKSDTMIETNEKVFRINRHGSQEEF